MKNSCFKKMLMMLALVIVIQNGAIIVSNADNSYSDDSGIAPCSDVPDFDEDYD